MTEPCQQCPFRTDIEPYLTPERAREIADGLVSRQATFACHKTVTHVDPDDSDTDDDGYRVTANEQHCAGAMIVLERANKPNQMMRICERIGQYDRRKLNMAAPVFRSLAAFVAAQKERRKRGQGEGIQARDRRANVRAVHRRVRKDARG